jgi:cytidylate kinase
MKDKKIIIAIDGLSGSGKSSTAKLLAKEMNYKYLDSGAMYRAITLYIIENSIDYKNLKTLKTILDKIELEFIKDKVSGSYEIHLNNKNVEQNIRSKKVSELVSEISKISIIRKKLVQMQRTIGDKKGIVMEGRDIGTVVFPKAELKIFMQADLNIRAKRRFNEFEKLGKKISLEEVKSNLIDRDNKDSNREDSPLKVTSNSLILDTTSITLEEQIEFIL